MMTGSEDFAASSNSFVNSLQNYYVSSEFGFLLENPLEQLPQYFDPWNSTASNIKDLLRQTNFADKTGQFKAEDYDLVSAKFIDELDIDWFFLVTAEVESIFAKALPSIFRAVQNRNSIETLAECLNVLSFTIRDMKSALLKLHKHLRPEVFYHKIRPFLSGYTTPDFRERNPPDGGLWVEGLGLSGPLVLSGGSAAQSSTLQLIDAFLCVRHEDVEQYLLEMREYMPPAHRRLIVDVENAMRSVWLSSTLLSQNQEEQQKKLETAYANCLQKLCEFRSTHGAIVLHYVVNAKFKSLDSEALASALWAKTSFQSLQAHGTGGTRLEYFLDQVLRDTQCAAENFTC